MASTDFAVQAVPAFETLTPTPTPGSEGSNTGAIVGGVVGGVVGVGAIGGGLAYMRKRRAS